MSQEEIRREFQRGVKSWKSSQLLLESELDEDALSRAYREKANSPITAARIEKQKRKEITHAVL